MGIRLIRGLFVTLLALGGVIAAGGGVALGVWTIVDPTATARPTFEHAWLLALGGFSFAALFGLTLRWTRVPAPPASKAPAPAPAPEKPAETPDAPALLQQMRTHVGLEMWDLALEKANEILERFPGTPQAEIVERNMHELRWKAEPKPAPPTPPASPAPQRKDELRKRLQHIRTYMELEMWDLARQKAVELAKADPESEEATEAGRLVVEIENRTAQSRSPVE